LAGVFILIEQRLSLTWKPLLFKAYVINQLQQQLAYAVSFYKLAAQSFLMQMYGQQKISLSKLVL